MKAQEIVIESPRLLLRSMRADDIDALLAIFTDPNVMAAFHAPPFTRHQMHHWLQRNLDHQTAHGYGLFSVLLRDRGILIGDCGLEVMDVDGAPAVELGYDFRSDYWGQGYATEAALAVRDFAFTQLHLPHLISLIRVGNAPSKRVAEKIGMRYTSSHTSGELQYWKYELVADTDDKTP